MNERRQRWIVAIVLFSGIIVYFEGCGIYSFSGSAIPPHIKTVAVPLFEDRTTEFGIDQKLTDALIEAVTKDNTLKISDTRESDSVLKGTILRIQDQAGQYDANEEASDFRVNITVTVSFEDVKKRKILWEETWTHWGRYETDRNVGINEAVGKIINDILNRTVSAW